MDLAAWLEFDTGVSSNQNAFVLPFAEQWAEAVDRAAEQLGEPFITLVTQWQGGRKEKEQRAPKKSAAAPNCSKCVGFACSFSDHAKFYSICETVPG